MADIGETVREVEFEPIPEHAPAPVEAPPVEVPEEVPA